MQIPDQTFSSKIGWNGPAFAKYGPMRSPRVTSALHYWYSYYPGMNRSKMNPERPVPWQSTISRKSTLIAAYCRTRKYQFIALLSELLSPLSYRLSNNLMFVLQRLRLQWTKSIAADTARAAAAATTATTTDCSDVGVDELELLRLKQLIACRQWTRFILVEQFAQSTSEFKFRAFAT